MNWTGPLVFLVVVMVMLLLKRANQISPQQSRELLGKGAAVVDVRTKGEFAGERLPKAINIPLDEIQTVLPRQFPDRGTAVLLHCQSGMRSGVARRQLRALGYTHAFNLGSYARAKQILAG